MGSRIEAVEVLSFRLELPKLALDRLPSELGPALPVRVEKEEDGTLWVEHEGQESFLRFHLEGDGAELVEISISQDTQGHFFQKVLGALMVRFHGDLRARLVFDPRENRAEEPWAEVSIEAGRTTLAGPGHAGRRGPPGARRRRGWQRGRLGRGQRRGRCRGAADGRGGGAVAAARPGRGCVAGVPAPQAPAAAAPVARLHGRRGRHSLTCRVAAVRRF